MSRPLQRDEGGVLWGVKHAQGIAWQDSERDARERMRELAARDEHRRREARGYVRLIRRELGPIEVVENPYDSEVSAVQPAKDAS